MQLDDATEAELEEIVGRLDALVPSEGAHLTIPADAEGCTSAGNRLGYLRLGIEILVAALHPVPAGEDAPAQIVPQLGSILSEGSRPPFETCEIDESIGSRPPVQSRLGALRPDRHRRRRRARRASGVHRRGRALALDLRIAPAIAAACRRAQAAGAVVAKSKSWSSGERPSVSRARVAARWTRPSARRRNRRCVRNETGHRASSLRRKRREKRPGCRATLPTSSARQLRRTRSRRSANAAPRKARVERHVDEPEEPRGGLVERAPARGSREERLVPGCEVLLDVLEVVEELQEDAVAEGEALLRRARLGRHEVEVGKHGAAALLEADREQLLVSEPERALLIETA